MVDMKFLFPILFVMAVVSVQAQNSVRLKGKLVGIGNRSGETVLRWGYQCDRG